MLFEFWEQYLRRLEGPVATQVWGRCLQFFKDIIGTFREFKLPVFYSLRYVDHDTSPRMPALTFIAGALPFLRTS